jgi:microcin C transport system ATP-binding protein
VAEVLMIHKGIDLETARPRVVELLTLVGLPEPESYCKRYPHELSGGQRQRIMIASALANNPDLLIADEPTTALDVTIQAQILALLKDLQKKTGLAILLITHDLGIVRHMAQRVYVMRKGVMVETNTTQNLFETPAIDYTKQLIDSEPKGLATPLPAHASEILSVKNLRVYFPVRKGLLRRVVSHVKAVDDVSFTLKQGETLGVVGESGSGKTTLGMAILRLTKATGTVTFMGQDILSLPPNAMRAMRQKMQVVFQDPYSSLSPRMSVGDLIGEGLRIHNIGDAQSREKAVCDLLGEVGLDAAMRHRYPHEFSGGQRQRIAIARALILKPSLLILDEPTSALDRTVQAQILALLRDIQLKYGLSYIFISHDLRVVRAVSHRILVLRHGVAVEYGSSESVFTTPQHDYTKRLLAAAL